MQVRGLLLVSAAILFGMSAWAIAQSITDIPPVIVTAPRVEVSPAAVWVVPELCFQRGSLHHTTPLLTPFHTTIIRWMAKNSVGC